MIGKNINKIRRQKGYTLSDLAKRTGISKSYLSNIERDLKKNPSIQVIEKISSVLEVDLKTLLEFGADIEADEQLEQEWLDFIQELKRAAIDKDRIHEYRILVEFIKWHSEKREQQ